ncbi:MAG: hypothetical protein C0404_08840 [Verrucomicrobia bacterium]|nr:hypothetical protein [Verrucomicrobiota bacterium]
MAVFVDVVFELAGIPVCQWARAESNRAVFQCFVSKRWEAGSISDLLRRGLRESAPGAKVAIRRIRNEDWKESWKAGFKTERVSRRIVIKPTWEKPVRSSDACVIEIDPGMSFGTGRHFTTRYCLRLIDRLASRNRSATFCDLGCGSGILSIAAAMLGFTRVTALDNDAGAVRIARENAARNGVGRLVKCSVADLARMRTSSVFDVVAANLDVATLSRFSRKISRMVSRKSSGQLVISGLTPPQYTVVKKLFEAQGFCEIHTAKSRTWQGGCFQRAHA